MTEVFKFDGTLQCGLGKEIPLGEMQGELESLGAVVTSGEKRNWPGFIICVCGAPTGQCNVFRLDEESWPKLSKVLLGAGYRLWPTSDVDRNEVRRFLASLSAGGDLFPWPWRPEFSLDERSVPVPQPMGTAKLDTSKCMEELIGKRVRIYREGDMITHDYRLDRVNIVLNRETATIVDIWFG